MLGKRMQVQNGWAARLLLVAGISMPLCFTLGCWRPAGIGIGGRYLDAKAEVTKRHGDLNKAVANLEYIVIREPFYHDSLTLLGRAYYKQGRYADAAQLFQRAVAVDGENEIAWIMLGLTELRLGNDSAGFAHLQGGLTLLSKHSKSGYKGIEFWDRNGLVGATLRRAAFTVLKGPEEKEAVIARTEMLLQTVDNEEWMSKQEQFETALDNGK